MFGDKRIQRTRTLPMNDHSFGNMPVEATALPAYKDRSNGLIVFGILTIFLGCLCGLFVFLMLVGQVAVSHTKAPQTPLEAILPAISIYVVLAVALVWLGIGSIKARRWARALLLIFSWSWLVVGLITLVAMVFVLPKVLANIQASAPSGQPAMPAAAIGGIMIFACLILGVFFIIVPAVWIFFYGSSHVKATCEARDRVTRWTDACPLPVLGFCLWLLFSALMMLVMPVMAHGVMPFFGTFLTGLPGSLLCLVLASLWTCAAWLLYQLDVRGWWLILIAMIVFMVSALLTYARHDILEIYQLMGYPQAQIDQIQKTGLLTGNSMTWVMTFSMLPFLGYILFIKKYFSGKT
jgi:hypothetical protein